MSELDDTLDAILDSARYRMARHSVLKAEIMQAVEKDGYIKPSPAPPSNDPKGPDVLWMSGQVWYSKLAQHLNSYDWTQDEKDSILQAAFEVAEGLDKV